MLSDAGEATRALQIASEIKECCKEVYNNSNIYVTDKFVPASLVNPLANITICHGGQGTVQTAIYSKTPIIGFAMQPEQQINLDNIVNYGGAVSIPIHMWKSSKIEKVLFKILSTNSYKENIDNLSNILNKYDGRKNAAEVIWNFIIHM